MKYLLVSDLHYVLRYFDWLLKVSDQYDAVVIAGDQIDGQSHVYLRVQIPVILKYLEKLQQRTQILVCSGNHDLDGPGANGERRAKWLTSASNMGIAIDGDSVVINNILFTVCAWWDGPKSKDLIAKQLARDAVKPRSSWVWVYHGPPDNSPTSWTGKRHFGDPDLSAWIDQYQPNIVLTGHIHEAPFVESGSWVDKIGATWIFNSGRDNGEIPPHIVINHAEDSAQWWSSTSRDLISLSGSLQQRESSGSA